MTDLTPISLSISLLNFPFNFPSALVSFDDDDDDDDDDVDAGDDDDAADDDDSFSIPLRCRLLRR